MSSIWVTGAGAVGPHGLGLPAGLHAAPAAASWLVPDGLALKEGFPAAAMRWLDASSLWWVNAARQALGQGTFQVETAQVVGLGLGSNPPVAGLMEQVRALGFAAMTPALFPYSVGNAPAAQAGILLKLRGAAITLCAKEGAGLAAIVEGCRAMEAGLFEGCVAGGVDHLDPFLRKVLRSLRRGNGVHAGEGAYAVVLARAQAPPEPAMARVAGWASTSVPCAAYGFPQAGSQLDRVVNVLLARTGWSGEEVDLAALSGDTPALRLAAKQCSASRLPSARSLPFQPILGACGASWAGAAGLAAADIAAQRSRRALLVALCTGGAAWGLALEAPHAQ